MGKNWVLLLIVLFRITFFALPALAEIKAGTSELGLSLGFLRGDNLGTILVSFPDDPTTPQDESAVLPFETTLKDSFFLGFEYTFHFTTWLGTELDLALVPKVSVEASDLGKLFDMDIRFFNANAVVHLRNGRFVPFVTAGIGIADFSSETIDSTQFIKESDFAFNFGGGFKVFLTDTLLLRADIRDYRTTPEDLNTLNLIRITGGVAFTF